MERTCREGPEHCIPRVILGIISHLYIKAPMLSPPRSLIRPAFLPTFPRSHRRIHCATSPTIAQTRHLMSITDPHRDSVSATIIPPSLPISHPDDTTPHPTDEPPLIESSHPTSQVSPENISTSFHSSAAASTPTTITCSWRCLSRLSTK